MKRLRSCSEVCKAYLFITDVLTGWKASGALNANQEVWKELRGWCCLCKEMFIYKGLFKKSFTMTWLHATAIQLWVGKKSSCQRLIQIKDLSQMENWISFHCLRTNPSLWITWPCREVTRSDTRHLTYPKMLSLLFQLFYVFIFNLQSQHTLHFIPTPQLSKHITLLQNVTIFMCVPVTAIKKN